MSTRIGVDVGGTFTDLDLTTTTRPARSASARSRRRPAAPEQGVIAAVTRRSTAEHARLGRVLPARHDGRAQLAAHPHGRRRRPALHARVPRRARDPPRRPRRARTTSSGTSPSRSCPARLRLPVTERILADGSVHIAARAEADVARRARGLRAPRASTAVAIAFMNAYANPAHELEAEAPAARGGLHRRDLRSRTGVSGEYREYERTSHDRDRRLRPAAGWRSYLERLEERLRRRRVRRLRCIVTRSGGGAMTVRRGRASARSRRSCPDRSPAREGGGRARTAARRSAT